MKSERRFVFDTNVIVSALLFENVKAGPSPDWLKKRLESIGVNSINSVVDVTNYIMAELPQPTHAFDADKLAGDTIFVRTARTGENLGLFPAANQGPQRRGRQ